MAATATVVGLGLGAACESSYAFRCQANLQCGGEAARCELSGYCSFADDSCPSGRRYGSHAETTLAGGCVDAEELEPSTGGIGPGDPDPSDAADTGQATDSTGGDPGDDSGPSDALAPRIEPWWHPDWRMRRRVRFDNQAQPGLTDEPILIRLAAEDLERFEPGGRDLRVIDDDGTTALPYEIVSWSASAALVWVRVPRIDAGTTDDHVWLYYDNPDAAIADNPESVWAIGYAAVWHLEDLRDSSPTPHLDATDHGTTSVPGIAGGARSFDGLETHLDIGAPVPLDDFMDAPGTVSAFIRPDAAGSLVDKRPGWSLSVVEDQVDHHLRFVRDGLGVWATTDGTIELGSWHHVAVVGVPPLMYVDGEQQPVQAVSEARDPVSDVGVPMQVGASSDPGTANLAGVLDEVRLADVARSGASIRAESRTMTGGLVTLGAPEEH